MVWNWQLDNWPDFTWDETKLTRVEKLFIEGTGIVSGATRHIEKSEQEALTVELMSIEALDTSEIEGEYLNRDSVQASIKRILGLSTSSRRATPAESGVAEMMVNLYQTSQAPLSKKKLSEWHDMLMNGRRDLNIIGNYRTHTEPMQIVSDPGYARKIHFEAPPSKQVAKEMSQYLKWIANTAPSGGKTLPAITRAGIAHLWFESIHPFEDGNGRIGRAISEKILNESLSSANITVLAKILLKRRKEYYMKLGESNKSLEITSWLLWFASVVIEAQKNTVAYIEFIINKTKMLDRLRNKLNKRQEKVLLRIFREGLDGFTGGLSASNYMTITGAASATTTRDLHDLVNKSALVRTGEKKSTRYFLAMDLNRVNVVTVEDIL